MIFFLALRMIFSSVLSWQILEGRPEMEIYRFLAGDTTGLFLMMRWLWAQLCLLLMVGLAYGQG